ncbi:cytochrome P450 71A1-like [Papaver somniferum]|uniref:cytochrome P450 71A1-like n=1 Tax=Papaver somniferum TaxID=3469 RepID=UPI000E6F98FD|nr:cytochrome P450 71A1-like [Papaver somniferum]
MEKIAHTSRESDMINLIEIISNMSNYIIFRCSLGDNFNKDYAHKFIGLVKNTIKLMESTFSFGDYFPWLKWMDTVTGLEGKLRRIFEEIDTFFNQVIDGHLLSHNSNAKHDDPDKVEDKRNFIDLLILHAEKEPNLNLTRDDIKGIIMDMFVAGSDTSSTLIEWTMAELIKNPNVMKKA